MQTQTKDVQSEQDVRSRIMSFMPSAHGLRFPNRFPGIPAPFHVPGIDKSIYGLCGGMCFTVLDYLHAGQPVPDSPHIPEKNTPFWRYLYRRQFDSFGPGLWYTLKFALWTLLPNAAVRRRTRVTLEKVLTRLEAGEPTVLGIVYVGVPQSFAVWENHQVLAYRAEQPAPGITDLYIYDPNHPGDDTDFIRCEASDKGVVCAQKSAYRADRPVRGFFPVRYAPKRPPALFPE